jgi:geranylgeranyl diphosphate synthase type II
MSRIKSIAELQALFSAQLDQYSYPVDPLSLYEPMHYIMSIRGKRIRPVLLLAAYNLYKDDVDFAFEGGLALEVFHNFTLLHDDIMDAAEIRRGQPTVHIKYDNNKAILTGDVMMIYAYQLLEKYGESYLSLCKVFTQTSREVCEGQSMDMEFETTDNVTISDYLKMIEYKTSVLIAAALKMGGILAGASQKDLKHLYEFGKNLGIAFQIQDDLLDTFGTEEQLGKKIGGDIEQKKKTYLYLKSLELLSETQANRLRSIFLDQHLVMDDKLITEVKELLRISHVKVHAEELKLVYQQLALSHLATIQVSEEQKIPLKDLANSLLNRTV